MKYLPSLAPSKSLSNGLPYVNPCGGRLKVDYLGLPTSSF